MLAKFSDTITFSLWIHSYISSVVTKWLHFEQLQKHFHFILKLLVSKLCEIPFFINCCIVLADLYLWTIHVEVLWALYLLFRTRTTLCFQLTFRKLAEIYEFPKRSKKLIRSQNTGAPHMWSKKTVLDLLTKPRILAIPGETISDPLRNRQTFSSFILHLSTSTFLLLPPAWHCTQVKRLSVCALATWLICKKTAPFKTILGIFWALYILLTMRTSFMASYYTLILFLIQTSIFLCLFKYYLLIYFFISFALVYNTFSRNIVHFQAPLFWFTSY